ncbi:MAG: folate-binding protein YgfZ [Gemmatimonadetes bacterium]|nr:folate-binding protein YgfZ [Gemmatimonadota bacterium]
MPDAIANREIYEALQERWGWTRRDERALFRVSGERHVDMLNGLVTNDVKGTPVGRAVWAFLLTPKGKIIADLRILRRGNELWLDAPRAAVDGLVAAFKKFLPPRFARAELSADALLLGVYGPRSEAAVAAVTGLVPPREPLEFAEAERDGAPVVVLRDDVLGLNGYEIFAGGAAIAAFESALAAEGSRSSGVRLDEATFDVLRVEAGLPRYGTDVTEANLVQETGWEDRAVSYTKGCFVGQEVVVRVEHRGHANRLLRGLRFDAEPAAAGTSLFHGEKAVGVVTSAVVSPRLGPIGLGTVRREIAVGARVRVGTPDSPAHAEVTSLPFPR